MLRRPGRLPAPSPAPAMSPGTFTTAASRRTQVAWVAPRKSSPNTIPIHRGNVAPITRQPAPATRVAIREAAASRRASAARLLTPNSTSRRAVATMNGTPEIVIATTRRPNGSTSESGVTKS